MCEDRLFKRISNFNSITLDAASPRGFGVVMNLLSSVSNSHRLQLEQKTYCTVAKYAVYFNTVPILLWKEFSVANYH
jgi:hypothetical protein